EPRHDPCLPPRQLLQLLVAPAPRLTGGEVRPHHSYRKASIGSTRVARRAGIYLAASATAASNIGAAANVSGSSGAVPKSSFAINRTSKTDPASPKHVPAPINAAARPSTSRSTSVWVAPTLSRIPNSRVR